ncbi:unnamed protein product [Durusdinium trenchii]|uniref:Uncharacterized protein n=2 Tax=Durusdinium trenchii TaxID=1381693 RepID=A0ABP0RH03_9DINO
MLENFGENLLCLALRGCFSSNKNLHAHRLNNSGGKAMTMRSQPSLKRVAQDQGVEEVSMDSQGIQAACRKRRPKAFHLVHLKKHHQGPSLEKGAKQPAPLAYQMVSPEQMLQDAVEAV